MRLATVPQVLNGKIKWRSEERFRLQLLQPWQIIPVAYKQRAERAPKRVWVSWGRQNVSPSWETNSCLWVLIVTKALIGDYRLLGCDGASCVVCLPTVLQNIGIHSRNDVPSQSRKSESSNSYFAVVQPLVPSLQCLSYLHSHVS
jgi:hypothetical protein